MKTYKLHGLLLGLAAGAFIFTGTALAHTGKHHHMKHHPMMMCHYSSFYDHWPEMRQDDPRYHREDSWRYRAVSDDFDER